MRNIMTIIRERDIAYNLLETGKTGEPTPQIRYDSLENLDSTEIFSSSGKQVLVFYDIINPKNVFYLFIKIVIINYCGVNVKHQYLSSRIIFANF